MNVTEALRIQNAANASDRPVVNCVLACSFTPLHMTTLLGAHLQQLLPDKKIQVHTKVFGSILANLQHPSMEDAEFIAVVMEWSDLDPRLGFRHLGGWNSSQIPLVLQESAESLQRLVGAFAQVATGVPIVVSLPSLRLPPVFLTPNSQTSTAALELRLRVAEFACACAALPKVKVINADDIAMASPLPERYDVRSDLTTGFPYSIAHASVLAEAAARCLMPQLPLKGLITDLDDTLWKGLVGEVGPHGVSWDLDRRAQLHGIYQQLLESLAESGVLIAAASKNEEKSVASVWRERSDIILRRESVFPWEVHWKPKSESIAAILIRWNIGASSVVFVDDSPHEVAEVKAAFPEMECIVFPKAYGQALELFYRLRELFGKQAVLEEDKLRLNTIRNAAQIAGPASDSAVSQKDFLRQLQSVVTFTLDPSPQEERILQLVNKTNQFNLNGLRRTEAEWNKNRQASDSFILGVAYEDKLGPLGTIGVLQGCSNAGRIHLETWVLSCRAFSRLIEHQCLAFLFGHFTAREILLEYRPTSKNAPTAAFLAEYIEKEHLDSGKLLLAKSRFESKCPPLDQQVRVVRNEVVCGK